MIVFPIVATLMLAAHFYRTGGPGPALAVLLLPLLLMIRRRWGSQVLGILLGAGALEWIRTLVRIAMIRARFDMPWIRMSLILGAVAIFTGFAAWVLLRKQYRSRKPDPDNTAWISSLVFLLVTAILGFIQIKVKLDMLILNRFLPGFGWVEIVLLAGYGAFLADRIRTPSTRTRWRIRAWRLFSLVFFGQLILGLLGLDRFLMTGELHLPIPALIAAGPVYRGHGLFMIILFLSTVILVGPAWCSHLCYIGSWDDAMARSKAKAGFYRNDRVRLLIAILVIAAAIILRMLGVGWLAATVLAASFGLTGVAVMVAVSRQKGSMVHCTVYCPIGLFANWLGKLNPFRIRIDHSACTECMACAHVCRYSALELSDIRSGKPSLTCTLCADCITGCPQNTIRFQFPGLSASAAHNLFTVLIVTLHAVFLGVARI